VLTESILAADNAAELADALLDAGALAVTIEDANALDPDTDALYGEPGQTPPGIWPQSRLRVLTDAQRVTEVIERASGALGIAPPRIESTTPVDDIDWVSRSQAQFTPIRISARLCIAPSWHADDVQADVIVRLDPGAAFGTGAHPTTQLCLAWLDRHLRPGASVLDVGCGSGILSIAAAKLGAGRVVGTDIDLQALAVARANAAENDAAASYTDPDSLGAATFDIVLANILANPLKLLAPALLARVSPRGSLVLSGVLERQAPDLVDAYRAVESRFELEVDAVQEGWALLVGTRIDGR
jgi:ribosomal protein L11 methyltransferase